MANLFQQCFDTKINEYHRSYSNPDGETAIDMVYKNEKLRECVYFLDNDRKPYHFRIY